MDGMLDEEELDKIFQDGNDSKTGQEENGDEPLVTGTDDKKEADELDNEDDYSKLEFINWRLGVEREISEVAQPKTIKTREENARFKKIERILRSNEGAIMRLDAQLQEKPNELFSNDLKYYETIQSMLLNRLYNMDQVSVISSFLWGEDRIKYSPDECENFAYFYNCVQEYIRRDNDNYVQRGELIRRFGDLDFDDVESRNEINEQLETLQKQSKCYNDKILELQSKIPINLDMFNQENFGLNLEELSQYHAEYITYLSQELKQVQDRQVELSALYKSGELEKDPAEAISDLQRRFYDLQREKSRLENAADILEIPESEKLKDVVDVARISGKEVFEQMTPQQRYMAKQSIHEMKKGKRPGKLRNLTLHLPSKKMDELIEEYIDFGDLDIEEIMGKSIEELTIELESEKLAQKKIEEKAKKAEEHSEPSEGESKDGESHEDEESHEDGEKPEPSDSEPKDFEAIKARLLENFVLLSTEDRVDILTKLYDIHEKGKQILMMFDQLPRETQLDICSSLDEKDRDVSREKE